MRTETYQLPNETYEQYQQRMREIRRRRQTEDSNSSYFSPSPIIDTSPFSSGFDQSSSSSFCTDTSDTSSTSCDSFVGGGGDFGGMTLRDYFAAKAMQAFITSGNWRVTPGEHLPRGRDAIPGLAYMYADAMVSERDKK